MASLILPLCLPVVLSGSPVAAVTALTVVEEGALREGVFAGKPWRQGEGYLEAGGVGEGLWAKRSPAPGDFHVKARLRIIGLAKSAASFRMGGSHFGFEGAGGETFVSGPLFGGMKSLGPPPAAVRDGRWFQFEVSRQQEVVRFLLNGEEVFHADHGEYATGVFGLRPWRATMQVSDFTIEAATMTEPELPLPPAYTIPTLDLANDRDRQVIVDREPGQYLGHPTTVLLDDQKTMFIVYPKGHGRGAIVMKKSTDGGLTWSERLPVPDNWATSLEVPTLYPTVDPEGQRHLIMFSGLYPVRLAHSEDEGETWTPLEPVGDFGGVVAMADCVRLKDGRYAAFFHDDGRFLHNEGKRDRFRVYMTLSADGGLTWGEPRALLEHPSAHLCEPGIVRSPDGNQLAMLLRENSRQYNSFISFSDDEAATWSKPRQLPAALTGDRHQGLYGPDGRLFISFRDTTRESPTKGDWVGWVGTYDDLVAGREGQYRVRLMDNTKAADCAYPAVELLPDGTFVCTTYGHWTEGESPYIVSVRFKLEELDALAAKQ